MLRLDRPFDLGRSFDWVLCLEVAEHLPRDAGPRLLADIRRHARQGMVFSWSGDVEQDHPSAHPWPEVRHLIEEAGFYLDEVATRRLRPQVKWMQGNVRVFRV